MHSKFFASVLLLGIATLGVGAQDVCADGTYYLIAANPAMLPASYATTLYRLDEAGGALNLVRTVTTQRQGALFVRAHEDAGFVLVASDGGPHRIQFDLIHYDDPTRTHQIEAGSGTTGGMPSVATIASPTQGTVLGLQYLVAEPGSGALRAELKGLRLDGGTAEVNWQDFSHQISTGYLPGSSLEGLAPDVGPSHAELDGKFVRGYPGGVLDVDFSAPDLTGLTHRNGIVEIVQNQLMRVLTGYEMLQSEGEGSSVELLVLNKKENRWSKLAIPGSHSSVTAFGSRLAVVVGEDSDSYKGKRLVASSLANEYHASLRDRLSGTARTGRVLLIETKNNSRVEFQVESADVDVLLVDATEVLYRVGPRFYLRHWRHDGLDAPRLLLSDQTVGPAVHWAFKQDSINSP